VQLTLRQVSELFQVPEANIYRWVRDENLPATVNNGQYRFNRSELIEWATVNRHNVPSAIFRAPFRNGGEQVSLAEALTLGGIHYDVSGNTQSEVFRAVVECLKLSMEIDRESLVDLLSRRERRGSTAIGDGIAIPHPRHPLVIVGDQPVIALYFLSQPVDFLALDQKPVDKLFVLLTSTPRMHLQCLAQISCALRDAAFHRAIQRRASREEILAEATRIDQTSQQLVNGELLASKS